MSDGGAISPEAETVLGFWFNETERENWFRKDDAFDEAVRRRFAEVYRRAAAGQLDEWRDTPRGCVALVIVLDQFPRNMFRGDARSFATDAAARTVLRHALDGGFDRGLTVPEKQFLYMPLQHSEDAADQALSVELNAATGDADLLKWAEAHQRIVGRFGRFPHRNKMLGRETTPEEAEFLKEKGSSF
ncbi:MAG: DUF924 domain-containing protein [Alphaproteobacteria bacterium]|nr:DUF924 domain-containing protein [Alphaproteobacteria bacterium]